MWIILLKSSYHVDKARFPVRRAVVIGDAGRMPPGEDRDVRGTAGISSL